MRRRRQGPGGPSAPALGREALLPSIIGRIPRLDLRARRMVEGFLAGLHRSSARGFSVEFSEHRRYIPGDDLRRVDWRVYARTDRLYLKLFLAETSLRAMLVVDSSASMAFGCSDGGMSKMEYAITLAAAVALLLQRQNDRVGLAVFGGAEETGGGSRGAGGGSVRGARAGMDAAGGEGAGVLLEPRSSRSHLRRILLELTRLRPSGGAPLHGALARLGERIRRRGMVIAFSDALCGTGPLSVSARLLAARGQDFMLFQVLDRSELAPDIRPPDGGTGRPWDAVLRDPETGRAFPAWDTAMLRACREKVARHVEAVGRLCTEAGGDHMLVVTDEPFDRALWRFLDARTRRR